MACYLQHYGRVDVLQILVQRIMGVAAELRPVTIPEGLPEDSKHTWCILSQMVVDCTQVEAQKWVVLPHHCPACMRRLLTAVGPEQLALSACTTASGYRRTVWLKGAAVYSSPP